MPNRYSRSLAPSTPQSIPDFLNREHQKLQTALDGVTALIDNHQAAIADDASGAANQATVNDILAALRAYGIILP